MILNREGKDTALQLEKRKQASKKVRIQFVENTFTHFNTLDENQKIKHTGKIDLEKSIHDDCSCDSFYYGMKFVKLEDSEKVESRYVAEHGTTFQCKHIIRAKSLRKLGMTEDAK